MRLLDEAGVDAAGARAVVVGRSILVGKPVALLLLERHATVTICHSRTRDLAGEVGARRRRWSPPSGQAGLIRGDWIRPGAVVIDVGINRGADGKLRRRRRVRAARASAPASSRRCRAASGR